MPSLRRLAAVTLAGAALLLTACAPEDSADSASSATRDVVTDRGTVTVPAEPKRVVVLNYALAGYLYKLDVPVTATIPEDANAAEGKFSDFWAAEAQADGTVFLPWRVDGFDLEAVLAADPDLIVGGGIGFPLAQAEQVYDKLTDIAPTVLVSGSLTTWRDQFSFLAEDVFGKGDEYAEYVAAYDTRVAEVRAAITPPEGPVAYLAFTADGTAYALVETVGLPVELAELGIEPAPIFASGDFEVYGKGGDMFELSTEQVGKTVTQPTVFVMGFNGETTDVATLKQNPVYAALPAFAEDRAHDLPYWVLRGDYDEAMALLDIIAERFA
ncbi:MAG TPA: ABC transporter substrate-binding protein [Phytomonospora sp.]